MTYRSVTLAAAALALGACNFSAGADDRDPGPQVSRNYQVSAFDRIAVAGPYEIQVVTGGQPGVSAKGGASLLDETEVVVEDGALKIMPKKRKGFHWGWSHRGKATFIVNAATLRAAAIAGSGGIAVDKVAGDFEGEVAGSGDLRLASVAGGKIKLSIAGSGDVSAAGKADAVDLSIAGSGDIDAKGLATRAADLSIAGSGNISAHATDTAAVSIMGSGDVEVTGGAKCTVSKNGSGEVRCS
ncbi:MAG: DUF2807 domain-containing protein [Sphingomonas sp.]|uniref:head GIN domain-containing protein n=1 Tax=Sphingomonas sp. TaxID=28214 RepID=UPI001801F91D|nr:head GIN domain-containing protein [Sphingomonas sp.]MBA3667609.1 DUF2807 domain-containing protein [Sphingomonas sp.]